MRKHQVQKMFDAFCDERIIVLSNVRVYGGSKSPQLHFELFGTRFIFDALKNRVLKLQARETLVFSDVKSLLEFALKHDKMKRYDPHFQGER